ncbi:MAG: hypothetical protein Q4P36_01740 [Bowdeniella nasicola]|nr:hypothetical protein [Bowdeniella nasicola]
MRLDGVSSLTPAVQRALNAAAAEVGRGAPVARVGDPRWRRRYRAAFRTLTRRAGPLGSVEAARAALASLYRDIRLPDGTPLASVPPPPHRVATDSPVTPLSPAPVTFDHTHQAPTVAPATSPAEARCPAPNLPEYGLVDGLMSPGARAALTWVRAHPEAWSLPATRVVVLGAGAELAPTIPLLEAGAQVHAVIRSTSRRREALERAARAAPGRLTFAPAEVSDVVENPRGLATHLAALPGPIVVVDSLYAPGRSHLQAALGSDLVISLLTRARPDVSIAYCGTPSEILWVGPTLVDASLALQGPNYLAAKRVARWRAALLTEAGHRVLTPTLPPARTASVQRTERLAAALSAAPRFGIYPAPAASAARLAAAFLVAGLAWPDVDTTPWTGLAVPAGMWRPGLLVRLGAAAASAMLSTTVRTRH